EHRGCQYQYGRIHEEGHVQRYGSVDDVEFDCPLYRRVIPLYFSCLYQGGVQVQVMRHHRRAYDTNGDIQCCVVGYGGYKAFHYLPQWWLGKYHFQQEARTDYGDKGDDECFHLAHAQSLQVEEQEGIDEGDNDTP